VGVVAFGTLVYLGLRSTTAANGLLLNSFIPVLIVLFGALFYGQRLRLAQTLGLLLSCVGVVVIIGHGEWQTLAAMRFAAGDLIVFVAMICWAVYTLWLRDFPAELDRLGMMGIQIVIGLVVLVPLAAWEHVGGQHASWNVHSILSVFYVGIFPSVLAYLLYMRGIARFGAARAGIFIHLMPVYGAVLSVVFLGESLHLYHAAGMAAILLGLVCTTLAGRGRPGH
jgi:drug/metabolite transporter (DMT)-like permease